MYLSSTEISQLSTDEDSLDYKKEEKKRKKEIMSFQSFNPERLED